FDARRFSLDEVRAIKSAVDGATVNDVIVSVCGGALRRYLNARHELPERSLVAMAPVSVRTKAQRGTAGNQVSTLSLPIRTDISDPRTRLQAVQKESVAAKTMSGALGSNIVTDLAHLLPVASTQLAAQAYARWGLAERMPPVFNTVITNVPGPAVPLYSMGSKLVANFGLGPIVHGVGLFQPVLSYNGEITVSAVSCREMMPDPAVYGDCLDESFEALKKATLKPTPSRTDSPKDDTVERKPAARKAPTRKKRTRKKQGTKKKAGTSAAKKKTRARKKTADS
ncbi:MAG: WS/DGAT domain-containing protein, partial [Pseudomonadota bacterium]